MAADEVVVIKAKDATTVNRIIQLGRKWTVFSLKSKPNEFHIMKVPMGPPVKAHLEAKHGDDLDMIYQPDPENCDLCPHPCPRDQARLRQLTKIGLPA
jgi:hypothetical protein